MSTGSAKGERVIRCPGCGGASVYSAANAYRPFCSARCKNHDFGAWASGDYAVPAAPDNPGEAPGAVPADLPRRRDDSLPH
jgi:uncharacterized protein